MLYVLVERGVSSFSLFETQCMRSNPVGGFILKQTEEVGYFKRWKILKVLFYTYASQNSWFFVYFIVRAFMLGFFSHDIRVCVLQIVTGLTFTKMHFYSKLDMKVFLWTPSNPEAIWPITAENQEFNCPGFHIERLFFALKASCIFFRLKHNHSFICRVRSWQKFKEHKKLIAADMLNAWKSTCFS